MKRPAGSAGGLVGSLALFAVGCAADPAAEGSALQHDFEAIEVEAGEEIESEGAGARGRKVCGASGPRRNGRAPIGGVSRVGRGARHASSRPR